MGCFNSIVINAPADKVWAAFQNFHDMSGFPNVIESVENSGDIPGDQIGAKRILNGVFHETLLYFNAEERILRYSIDDGPEATSKDNVKGYVGQVQVFSVTADNSTFVLWTSKWESSGGGVTEFCDPVYQALLTDLQAHFS